MRAPTGFIVSSTLFLIGSACVPPLFAPRSFAPPIITFVGMGEGDGGVDLTQPLAAISNPAPNGPANAQAHLNFCLIDSAPCNSRLLGGGRRTDGNAMERLSRWGVGDRGDGRLGAGVRGRFAPMHAVHLFLEGAGADGARRQFRIFHLVVGHSRQQIRFLGHMGGEEDQQFGLGHVVLGAAENRAEVRDVAQKRDLRDGDGFLVLHHAADHDGVSVADLDATGSRAAGDNRRGPAVAGGNRNAGELAHLRRHVENHQPVRVNVRRDVEDNADLRVLDGAERPAQPLGGTFSSIEYAQVGIILNVTPHINPDGLVILDVSPQVSQLTGVTVPTGNGGSAPIISSRSASSRVQIRHGNTIVIGGMMQDQKTVTVTKIPLLGDIPYFGSIFSRTQNDVTKTELLIFLTPHVAQEPDLLPGMSNDEMKNTELTPRAISPGAFQKQMDGMHRGESPTHPSTEPAVTPIANPPSTQPFHGVTISAPPASQ